MVLMEIKLVPILVIFVTVKMLVSDNSYLSLEMFIDLTKTFDILLSFT